MTLYTRERLQRWLLDLLASMLVVALPFTVHAQPEADIALEAEQPETEQPETEQPEVQQPDDSAVIPARGLIMPSGTFALMIPLNLNLSSEAALEPVSLSPDIRYSITNDIGVGLTHSFYGATGFLGFDGLIGTGVCVTGADNGCARVYDNVGIEGLYVFASKDDWGLVGSAGLQAGSFDPFTLSFKVGIAGTWHPRRFAGRLGLTVNPVLFLGITERNGGNDESLGLPITADYAITKAIHGVVQTGVGFDLDGIDDTYFVPLSLAGNYTITRQWTVGAVFSLPFLLAGDGFNGGGVEARTVTLIVGYRN